MSASSALGSQYVTQFQALYKKAKADGQTTIQIYSADAATNGPLYDAFEKRFPGITISAHSAEPGTLSATLSADLASGKKTIDIASTGSTEMIGGAQTGDFQSYEPFTAAFQKGNDVQADPNNDIRAVYYSIKVIAYNTSRVKQADAPTGWEDLLDSRWAGGKLGLRDPTTPGGGQELVSDMLFDGRFDVSYLDSLKAQGIKLLGSPAAAANAVATGQVSVGFPVNYNDVLALAKKGGPIGYVFPAKGGNLLSPIYQGIVKSAPDLEAAELFEDWSYTPEAIAALNTLGSYSPAPSAPNNAPANLPAFSTLDLFKPIPLAKVNEVNTGPAAQIQKIFH